MLVIELRCLSSKPTFYLLLCCTEFCKSINHFLFWQQFLDGLSQCGAVEEGCRLEKRGDFLFLVCFHHPNNSPSLWKQQLVLASTCFTLACTDPASLCSLRGKSPNRIVSILFSRSESQPHKDPPAAPVAPASLELESHLHQGLSLPASRFWHSQPLFVPLHPVDAAGCFLQLLPLSPEIHFCCQFCVWHPYLLWWFFYHFCAYRLTKYFTGSICASLQCVHRVRRDWAFLTPKGSHYSMTMEWLMPQFPCPDQDSSEMRPALSLELPGGTVPQWPSMNSPWDHASPALFPLLVPHPQLPSQLSLGASS